MPADSAHALSHLDPTLAEALGPVAGWAPETGRAIELSDDTWEAVERLIDAPPVGSYRPLAALPAPSALTERRVAAGGTAGGRPAFHCFGYGQYAKTQVLPGLGTSLDVATVHEINPLQIGPRPEVGPIGWDTAGWPRDGEQIDHAAVAGYHHTHAPLTVDLLSRGARHVIVEKPIATDADQLLRLLAAMEAHPHARVHVAFQRRYSPFNELLRRDLGGPPVSLAATVYEVPLPAHHWYRWAAVGNAVVSNGCHWIDYFLFLNDFEDVEQLSAQRLGSQILLGIELVNGASASISLRHEGSPRLGVRDHSVFWHGDATVTIDDLRRYRAERGFHRVRSRTSHPYRSLEMMYAEFGRRVEQDLPGDEPRTVRSSASVTLELARLADEQA